MTPEIAQALAALQGLAQEHIAVLERQGLPFAAKLSAETAQAALNVLKNAVEPKDPK